MNAVPSVTHAVQPQLEVDGKAEKSNNVENVKSENQPKTNKELTQEKIQNWFRTFPAPVIKHNDNEPAIYRGSFTEDGIYHTYFFTDKDIKDGKVTIDKRRTLPHVTMDSYVALRKKDSTSLLLRFHEDNEQFREEDFLFLNTNGHNILSLELETYRDYLGGFYRFSQVAIFCPNLRMLNLENCRFDPNFLSDIRSLTELRSLNLSYSEINDYCLELLLEGLPNLEQINLSYCKELTDDGLKKLAKHKNVTSVVLRDVKKMAPETIMSFSHLKVLHLLDLRDLSDQHLKAIGTLTNLTDLRTSNPFGFNVKVTCEGAKHLANLTNLTSLDISRKLLPKNALGHIARLTNLESLDVSYCDFGNEEIRELAPLKKLKTLNAHSCSYNEEALSAIGTFRELEELRLTYRLNLNEQTAAPLTNLTGLKVLKMEMAKIDDGAFSCFKKLTKLEKLELAYSTGYSSKALLELQPLKELRVLILSGGEFDDEGLKAVAEQFPKLERLILANCQKITINGLKHLVTHPQLKTVNLEDCYSILGASSDVYELFSATNIKIAYQYYGEE